MSRYSDDSNNLGVLVVVILAITMAGCAIMWRWYTAGVQRAVYQRQGIEMTQWEIFLGAEPAQKTITIKGQP